MVCNLCIKTVKAELEEIGIQYVAVALGEVITKEKLTSVQLTKLNIALQKSGLEILTNQKNDLFEKLKRAIIDMEHNSDENLKTSYSDYISLILDDSFVSLNAMFSEIEGISIEKYIIQHKIELVKELLVYNDLNLVEIAHKMHYSNAAQLTRQFRSVTGLTPSHFRQLRQAWNVNPGSN